MSRIHRRSLGSPTYNRGQSAKDNRMATGETNRYIAERGATVKTHFLRDLRLKVRELGWETRFYVRLGQTWPERLSIVKLLFKLYSARLMPFDTYRWEAIIRVRGARYVV